MGGNSRHGAVGVDGTPMGNNNSALMHSIFTNESSSSGQVGANSNFLQMPNFHPINMDDSNVSHGDASNSLLVYGAQTPATQSQMQHR